MHLASHRVGNDSHGNELHRHHHGSDEHHHHH